MSLGCPGPTISCIPEDEFVSIALLKTDKHLTLESTKLKNIKSEQKSIQA
jgi:hypothetical protein